MQARPTIRLMTPEVAGDVWSTASAALYESHKKGELRRRTSEEVENRTRRDADIFSVMIPEGPGWQKKAGAPGA